MVNNLPTSVRLKKIFFIFLIGIFIGVGGGVSYYFFRKAKDNRNIEKEGPKVTWNNEEGERLTGFEGEVVEFEGDHLKIKRKGATETIKVREDVLITLKIGNKKMKVVNEEEIKIGDKIALMAIGKESDLWTTGYIKIFRK